MALESWLVFVVVWFLAGIPLGPNAINCISISTHVGFRQSLWSVVGILLAALCFIAAVSLGLAGVMLAHANLFMALKVCGGLYLIWMGIRLWRTGDGSASVSGAPRLSAWRSVRKSFLISLSNPKAILAYGAVFSQFVDPTQSLTAQLSVLIPTALVINALIYGGYCGIGSGVARFLKSARRRLMFNRGVASFYFLAGGTLVGSELVHGLDDTAPSSN
ncbi:MAG: LysE family translocator [Alphaproteobacteria bacterium]|nr:LysE family translocator [Alphaproteobacteria bacterium]